jgi:hypothetical protein
LPGKKIFFWALLWSQLALLLWVLVDDKPMFWFWILLGIFVLLNPLIAQNVDQSNDPIRYLFFYIKTILFKINPNKTISYHNVKESSSDSTEKIFAFGMIVLSMFSLIFIAGKFLTKTQELFYVYVSTPECVILYFKSDNTAICSSFDRNSKEVDRVFKIVNLMDAPTQQVQIREERVGPLKLKPLVTPTPIPTLPPVPTNTSAPTITSSPIVTVAP